MSFQYINTGTSANSGDGDSLRSAFSKINNNFTVLSTASFGGGGNGYTGSQGDIGYTGSQGDIGYTGSQGLPGQVGTINDLSDVLTPTPAERDYLKYVGGIWVNSQLSIVDDQLPTLGGNLNTNGNIIQSTPGTFLVLRSTATGIALQGPVTIGSASQRIDGSLYIVRNTYSPAVLTQSLTFAQHHNIQDSTNFNFYRTRGSSTSTLAVQDGDELAEIAFVGHDGTTPTGAASITVSVDGNVSTGIVPSKVSFILLDTAGVAATRAEISNSGTWKIDKLSHISTTASSIAVSTNLIPAADVTYDLGSTSSQWRSLYVSSSTIYIGNKALSIDASNNITVDGQATGGGSTSYSPADINHWQGTPTVNTVAAALDELAARLTAVQNLEIDGGNAYTPPEGELIIDGNGA